MMTVQRWVFPRTLYHAMSETNFQGHNVLPFRRTAKAVPPEQTTVGQLQALLLIYDRLIALLRETDDEGLDALADSLVTLVVGCRTALSGGLDETAARIWLKEMRAGLHEIPRTLRALLPGLGPRLGESMERKLGIQFALYE